MATVDIHPGQVVEVEFQKSKEETLHFRTVIEESDGETQFLILAPMYKAMPFLFREYDVFDVVYSIRDAAEEVPQIYAFSAKSVRRERRGEIAYMWIERVGEVRKIQRRNFYRLSYVKEMQLEIVPEVQTEEEESNFIEFLSRDISAGGCRGIAPRRLKVNDRVVLHVDMDTEIFPIPGRVVVCNPVQDSIMKHDVRIEFLGLRRIDTNKMVQFINRIQAEYIQRMAGMSLEERLANYGVEDYSFKEKRTKKDWILWGLDGVSVLSGLLSLYVFYFVAFSPPTYYPRNSSAFAQVYLDWNNTHAADNIGIIFFVLLLCVGGLALNTRRLRRDGDHYRYTLIILGSISLIVLIMYVIHLFS